MERLTRHQKTDNRREKTRHGFSPWFGACYDTGASACQAGVVASPPLQSSSIIVYVGLTSIGNITVLILVISNFLRIKYQVLVVQSRKLFALSLM